MNVLDNISWKQLSDRIVAVDTNNGDYYTFNEVASTIWIAVSENKTVNEIVAQVMQEYDITDEVQVRNDIDTQLKEWEEMKLIN